MSPSCESQNFYRETGQRADQELTHIGDHALLRRALIARLPAVLRLQPPEPEA